MFPSIVVEVLGGTASNGVDVSDQFEGYCLSCVMYPLTCLYNVDGIAQ